MGIRLFFTVGLLSAGLARTTGCQAQGLVPVGTAEPATPDRYDILREQENFSFLNPDSLRVHPVRPDFFNPLKYLPLNRRPGYFLTLGLDVRYQYEIIRNDNWGSGGPPDAPPTNGYLLQRHMLHTDWRLGPHLRVFGQLLSDNVTGRRGGPRPQIDRDVFDLYQGFVELGVTLGLRGRAGLRVGRQEFLYGSERLLSMREGPNVRLSFDAARLVLMHTTWRVDLLVGRPVLAKMGGFDDHSDLQQVLWGAYAVHTLKPLRGGFDLYYFGLHKREAVYVRGVGLEQRQTAGVRFWSQDWGKETSAHPFGYNLELVGQLGRFGPSLIRAYYTSAIVHYHLAYWLLKPTLRLATDAVSGDQDRRNPDLQAFNTLFPRPYFGRAITPIGPGNLLDLHPGIELHFTPRLVLLVDVDWLWRQSLEDVIYGATTAPLLPEGLTPGAPDQPPLSRHRYIGRQLTADYSWQVSRHLSLGFTYAWIPAGAYLRDTTPGRTLSYYKPTVLFQF